MMVTINQKTTRKIIAIRYEISQNGYSSTKGVQICKNVSRQSVMELSEMNVKFGGIDIVTEPIVNYVSGSLASHILVTVGKITQSELEGKEDLYNINDIIGKTGIEYVFEDLLRGKNGIKTTTESSDGSVTEAFLLAPEQGATVVTTIDSVLQSVTEKSLAKALK